MISIKKKNRITRCKIVSCRLMDWLTCKNRLTKPNECATFFVSVPQVGCIGYHEK